MRRRRFIEFAAGTGITAVAGCSESDQDIEGGDHGDGETVGSTRTEMTSEPTNTPTMRRTDSPTPTRTDSPTPTPAKEADISFESSELKKDETSYSTDAYIVARVVNEGSGHSGEVRVKGRFYDADDTLLDSTTVSLHYLKPGETWECHVPYFDDGTEVKSHTADGEYSPDAPPLDVPALSVTDTELNEGDYDVTLTGTIVNELEETADYLGANARFWSGDVIVASGLDNITDVPAGENWSFEAGYGGYGERWKEVDDYDVVPELSIY